MLYILYFFSFSWKGAHLMLYVSNKGGGDTTGGIAHLSAVCNNRNHKKQSINEYQNSASSTGWVSQYGNHTYIIYIPCWRVDYVENGSTTY